MRVWTYFLINGVFRNIGWNCSWVSRTHLRGRRGFWLPYQGFVLEVAKMAKSFYPRPTVVSKGWICVPRFRGSDCQLSALSFFFTARRHFPSEVWSTIGVGAVSIMVQTYILLSRFDFLSRWRRFSGVMEGMRWSGGVSFSLFVSSRRKLYVRYLGLGLATCVE